MKQIVFAVLSFIGLPGRLTEGLEEFLDFLVFFVNKVGAFLKSQALVCNWIIVLITIGRLEHLKVFDGLFRNNVDYL